MRVGNVALAGSMKLISSPENVIAHVVALRAEEEPAAAAEVAPEAAPVEGAAAAAEPEVIKKGKKEEEGVEAEAKGKKK